MSILHKHNCGINLISLCGNLIWPFADSSDIDLCFSKLGQLYVGKNSFNNPILTISENEARAVIQDEYPNK